MGMRIAHIKSRHSFSQCHLGFHLRSQLRFLAFVFASIIFLLCLLPEMGLANELGRGSPSVSNQTKRVEVQTLPDTNVDPDKVSFDAFSLEEQSQFEMLKRFQNLKKLEATSCLDCDGPKSGLSSALEEQMIDFETVTGSTEPRPLTITLRKKKPGGTHAMSAEALTALKSAVAHEIARPRRVNKKLGNFSRGGNVSKGMCLQAVKDAVMAAGYFKKQGRPGGGDAKSFKKVIEKSPYNLKNLIHQYPDATDAPNGAILLYEGGASGHTEFRMSEKHYCSDYCSPVPIDRTTLGRNGGRRLIGVYLLK